MQQHYTQLLRFEIKLSNSKKKKRLLGILNKMIFGAMSYKQISDKHELFFEQQRDRYLDWGDVGE